MGDEDTIVDSVDLKPPEVPDHDLLRCIGNGAYGEVWLACNRVTGGYRAIKVIHRARFPSDRPYEREYGGIARFEPVSRKHPGLVDILHVGRDDAAGYFYYVMELGDADSRSTPDSDPAFDVEGYKPRTLETALKQRKRLPVEDCLSIGSAVANALGFLHASGLVHRDIKPSNIIFVDGSPRLADVGLITESGSARSYVGTDGYIPPEGPGRAEADIFALGIVLYELATGEDRLEFPRLPVDVPEDPKFAELNAVILKAADPNYRERHRSTGELEAELSAVDKGDSVRSLRRSKIRVRLLLSILLVLAATLPWWRTGSDRSDQPSGLARVKTLKLSQALLNAHLRIGDIDADGETDLVLSEKSSVAVVDANGLTHGQWQPANTRATKVEAQLVQDLDGDNRDEIFVQWQEGTNVFAAVLNQHFQEARRFRVSGSLRETPVGLVADSNLEPRRVVDLDGDGKEELVAVINSGFAGLPRAIVCFDYETGRELWRHDVAAFPDESAVVDLDGDGKQDVVMGSYAVDNGVQLPDGTDDSHSYLYAVRHDGELLWRREIGGVYSGCRLIEKNPNASEDKGIFVRVFGYRVARMSENESELGLLRHYDGDGNKTAEYNPGVAIMSCRRVMLSSFDGEVFAATDRLGRLHVVDRNLNLKRVRRLVHGRFPDVELHLHDSADLDGDAVDELILTSSQVENVSEFRSGNPNEPPDIRHFHQNEIMVLNGDLEFVARRVIAPLWKKNLLMRIFVANFGGDSLPEILCLENEANIFRLGSGDEIVSPKPRSATVPDKTAIGSSGLSDSIRNLLQVAYHGMPAVDVTPETRPSIQFETLAKPMGAESYSVLSEGGTLRSRSDRYLMAAKAETRGWLYVFQVDSSGRVDWLFPRNKASDVSSGVNPLSPGQVIQIPDSAEAFILDDTLGVEHVYAVFCADQWSELEKALAGATRVPRRGANRFAKVDSPFGLRTRGVAGVVSDGVEDLAAQLFSTGKPPAASRKSGRVYQADGPLLVVERWFHHADAGKPDQQGTRK